ncbi:hypothetical protein TL16_g11386 [Triparma laevis f. inornata]|uniref:CHAT domain-containing protein n=1 Tax=Triparma laevis f. inornata TaxID=1714386 RepID=A0A9W7BJT2_9STRA|nr:hypothetical protein TL16_g11386 [Triparma laevis f. inornata]
MIADDISNAIDVPDLKNLEVFDHEEEVLADETPAIGGDDFMHTDDFKRKFVNFVMIDTLLAMRWLDKKWHAVVEKKLTELEGETYGEIFVHGGNDFSWEEAFDRSERMQQVTKVVFLLNITKVGIYACYRAPILVVDIPEGITNIGANSFNHCDSLKHVKFPKSLISIGIRSFTSCYSLEEVDLFHTKVQELGVNAFGNCTSLREMKVPDSLQKFSGGDFHNCSKLVPPDINISDSKAVVTYLRAQPFNPNEQSTVGAVTKDIDTKLDAQSVREQEGVDIHQAETADGWSALNEDEDADEEKVRAMRQKVAQLAKEAKKKEEEDAKRREPPTIIQQNQHQRQQQEEEEKMQDLGDVELGEDNKLRLNIWDYGGQRIFQSFQHLLVVRRAVYLVAFDMQAFLDNPAKSYSFLDFWLHTIFIHAKASNPSKNFKDKGAPIFLVGTRGDQVKKPQKRAKISEILKSRYADLLEDQLVTNTEGDLFFFPVDNTSSEEEELKRFNDLRSLTEQSIVTDKLPPLLADGEPIPYVNDPVPIPWLNFIDELRKISSERKDKDGNIDDEYEPQPYLRTGLVPSTSADLDSDESAAETAMQIVQRCKVFEGIASEEEKKVRLEIVLKDLHELGLLIFFNSNESLKSYVILQPQWLMDQICFIIRDFRRHRLRRDERIQKSSIDEWKNLTRYGIASRNVIKKLWVGSSPSQVDFLRLLMVKLGLLVELNEDRKNWKSAAAGKRYLAPNIITTEDDDDDVLEIESSSNDGDESIFEITSSLNSKEYMPNGFLERMIAWLTPYSVDYSNALPSIYIDVPEESEVGRLGKLVIIVCSIQPISSGSPLDWKKHANHVFEIARDINDEFFASKLVIASTKSGRFESRGRNRGASTFAPRDSVLHTADVEEDEAIDSSTALFKFFVEKCMLTEEKASEVAKNLQEEEVEAVQDLIDLLSDDGEFKDILKEAGCKRVHIVKIRNGATLLSQDLEIARKNKEEAEPIVLVVTGGADLCTSEETRRIEKAFASDKQNRKALLLEENHVEAMAASLSANRSIKFAHFAMHGIAQNGQQTLAMQTSKEISEMRTPEQLGNILKACGGDISAIVLNVCQGASSARFFIIGCDYLIGWSTDVADAAAVLFADQFYKNVRDGDDVELAFFHAVTNLRDIHDWQTDLDPSSTEDKQKLTERRRQKRISTLKASGVPKIFKRQGGEGIEEITEPTKKTKSEVQQKRRSTFGYGAKLDQLLKGKDQLLKGQEKIVDAIEDSMSKVLKSVFECSEFDVPTTFVILPYEINKVSDGGTASTTSALNAVDSNLEKAGSWITKLTSVINVVDNNVAKVRSSAATKVQEIVASEKAKQFVPLMSVGLKTLCVANKATGLARCFGLPAPKVMSKEMQGLAENFVTSINEKSSVAGFDVLQSAIDSDYSESLESESDGANKKQLRGAKLREFKEFLKEKDQGNKFGGLQRVPRDDGGIVWTLPKEGKVGVEGVDEDLDDLKVRSLKVQLNAQNIKGERAAKQRRESQVDAEGQIKEMYQMK